MNAERYPQSVENWESWYRARMTEIKNASAPEDIERALSAIREYADAKWCFPYRLNDAQSLASQVRKLRGWKAPAFSNRIIGEGEAA